MQATSVCNKVTAMPIYHQTLCVFTASTLAIKLFIICSANYSNSYFLLLHIVLSPVYNHLESSKILLIFYRKIVSIIRLPFIHLMLISIRTQLVYILIAAVVGVLAVSLVRGHGVYLDTPPCPLRVQVYPQKSGLIALK